VRGGITLVARAAHRHRRLVKGGGVPADAVAPSAGVATLDRGESLDKSEHTKKGGERKSVPLVRFEFGGERPVVEVHDVHGLVDSAVSTSQSVQ
jgi:hypothetical protein